MINPLEHDCVGSHFLLVIERNTYHKDSDSKTKTISGTHSFCHTNNTGDYLGSALGQESKPSLTCVHSSRSVQQGLPFPSVPGLTVVPGFPAETGLAREAQRLLSPPPGPHITLK